MHEAILYDRLSRNRVRCRLCAHGCTIEPGSRGICAVRENVEGRLVSLTHGRLIARDIDPIEKKPLYHFYPGTRAYSIATVGCNFTCLHCQNHYISQYPRARAGRVVGDRVPAADVVAAAIDGGCHSIAYTYSEPTIAIEYVLEVMELARAHGLTNVWVTNGYFTADAFERIEPHLDAANVDLKGISDRFYHEIVGGNVRPVLHTIERLHRAGIWVEVTTLVIPGENDAADDLRWTAEAVVGISPQIPWHVSRFFPAHRMLDLPPTPVDTLEAAGRIGREAGVRYIYLGNVPGEGETTRCAECGEFVIVRSGHRVKENRLVDGRCPECGATVDGVWFPAE